LNFGGFDGRGKKVYDEIVCRGSSCCFIWWNIASTLNYRRIQKSRRQLTPEKMQTGGS